MGEKNALTKDIAGGFGKAVAIGTACYTVPAVCMAYGNYSAYSKLADGDYEGAKVDAALTILGGIGAKSVAPGSKPAAGAASIEEVSIAARARANGETIYTNAGRRAHAQEPLPDGFVRDVRVPGTRLRMDGYNPEEKLILELKPNNQRQINRGERQLERYCEACDSSSLGPGHKTLPVQTYEPSDYLQ